MNLLISLLITKQNGGLFGSEGGGERDMSPGDLLRKQCSEDNCGASGLNRSQRIVLKLFGGEPS